MSSKSIIVLLSILLFTSLTVNAQTSTSASLGVPFYLSTAGTYEVSFGSTLVFPSLEIQVTTGPAVVLLELYLFASADLPPNTANWALGLSAGFTFTVSAGTLGSVKLTTPSISTTIITALNSTFQLGCFQLTGKTYNRITFTLNSTSNLITIPLASTTSTYVFVSLYLQVPPVLYNTAVAVVANANQTYQWTTSSAVELAIQFNSSVSNQITVIKANVSAHAQAVYGKALNVYFNISASASSGFNALLQYTYTAAQLAAAGITDATQLQFSVYSTTSSSWTTPALKGSVDTNAMIVYQPTNSFSDWTITASASSGSSSTGSTNSTGSSSTGSGGSSPVTSLSRVIFIVPFLSLIHLL